MPSDIHPIIAPGIYRCIHLTPEGGCDRALFLVRVVSVHDGLAFVDCGEPIPLSDIADAEEY